MFAVTAHRPILFTLLFSLGIIPKVDLPERSVASLFADGYRNHAWNGCCSTRAVPPTYTHNDEADETTPAEEQTLFALDEAIRARDDFGIMMEPWSAIRFAS